jgi:hypothetical protein
MFEIVNYLLIALVYWSGTKILGRERTNIFLFGSLIWTLVLENLFVMTGSYDYLAYANYYCWNGKLITGYSGWAVMVFFVPLIVGLGWCTVALPAFIISDRLLPKGGMWTKATFAAIIMISMDMMLDPLSVVNEWWRWTTSAYYIRGVAVTNYIGWFTMLFFYAAIYERTVIEKGSFGWLRRLESFIFRRDTKDLASADMRTIGRIFYFRTTAFIPVYIIVTALMCIPVQLFLNNRYAPFNNVFPANYDQQYPASAKPAGAPLTAFPDDDVRKVKGPRCEIKADGPFKLVEE